jgi:hypothetical protein
MERKKYKEGELIFKEGDHTREAYRVISGRVEISLRESRERVVLAQLGPGEIFGEMSMIDDKPRSATASVMEPTEVEVVSTDDFNAMVFHQPDQLIPYLKSFFERLRRTNERLGSTGGHVADNVVSEEICQLDELHLKAANDKTRQRVAKPDLCIHKFPFRIGRWSENPQADVFVSNDYLIRDEPPFQISRNHCAIEREGRRYYVLDRGSTYGSSVNGHRIGGMENQMVMPLREGENELLLGNDKSYCRFKIIMPES